MKDIKNIIIDRLKYFTPEQLKKIIDRSVRVTMCDGKYILEESLNSKNLSKLPPGNITNLPLGTKTVPPEEQAIDHEALEENKSVRHKCISVKRGRNTCEFVIPEHIEPYIKDIYTDYSADQKCKIIFYNNYELLIGISHSMGSGPALELAIYHPDGGLIELTEGQGVNDLYKMMIKTANAGKAVVTLENNAGEKPRGEYKRIVKRES